jgi:hypothetical protein
MLCYTIGRTPPLNGAPFDSKVRLLRRFLRFAARGVCPEAFLSYRPYLHSSYGAAQGVHGCVYIRRA